MRGIKKKPFFLSYPQRQTAEFESRRPTRRRHDDGWKRARPDDSNRFFLMKSLDRIQFLRNSKRARTKKKKKADPSRKKHSVDDECLLHVRASCVRPAGSRGVCIRVGGVRTRTFPRRRGVFVLRKAAAIGVALLGARLLFVPLLVKVPQKNVGLLRGDHLIRGMILRRQVHRRPPHGGFARGICLETGEVVLVVRRQSLEKLGRRHVRGLNVRTTGLKINRCLAAANF